jgi:tRNA(Ile)-lysidine synthase
MDCIRGGGLGVSRVVAEVRRFLAAHAPGGGPGVVAVSGGPDSVALLRALLEAGCGPLTVAHVNHQLRGAESDADEAFVRELADRLGVAFRSTRVDTPKEATGDNLEATARRVRYAWLAEVAAEVGAEWVATGHTADDQAETVLHRLIRGTGLRGLRGIAPEQSWRAGGVSPLFSPESGNRGLTPPARQVLLRPLLTLTRAELLEHLASLGQPYREDSSNADPRFTRNRIRRELLPLLKTFNPQVVDVLGRLARQADEATAFLTQPAGQGLRDAELPRAGGVLVFDTPKLIPLGGYLIGEAFRLVWEREGWPLGEMTADHWHRLVDVTRGELTAAEFPGGVTARRVGRVVQVGRRS